MILFNLVTWWNLKKVFPTRWSIECTSSQRISSTPTIWGTSHKSFTFRMKLMCWILLLWTKQNSMILNFLTRILSSTLITNIRTTTIKLQELTPSSNSQQFWCSSSLSIGLCVLTLDSLSITSLSQRLSRLTRKSKFKRGCCRSLRNSLGLDSKRLYNFKKCTSSSTR